MADTLTGLMERMRTYAVPENDKDAIVVPSALWNEAVSAIDLMEKHHKQHHADQRGEIPGNADESLSAKLRELAKAIQVWDGETPAALLLFEAADKLGSPKREVVSPRSLPNDCCRTCEKKRIDAEIADGIGFPLRLMVLCLVCGNKRCPKATNHENACTGSNEPNQPGSAYQSENHIEG